MQDGSFYNESILIYFNCYLNGEAWFGYTNPNKFNVYVENIMDNSITVNDIMKPNVFNKRFRPGNNISLFSIGLYYHLII